MPGVCVNGHTRGLPVSKLVPVFPGHLFLQPSVEQVRQHNPRTTLSISSRLIKLIGFNGRKASVVIKVQLHYFCCVLTSSVTRKSSRGILARHWQWFSSPLWFGLRQIFLSHCLGFLFSFFFWYVNLSGFQHCGKTFFISKCNGDWFMGLHTRWSMIYCYLIIYYKNHPWSSELFQKNYLLIRKLLMSLLNKAVFFQQHLSLGAWMPTASRKMCL